MKNIIETLYPMGATLLGAGYDNALTWLGQLMNMDVIEFPSGTQVGSWTVPDEWIVRDAWIKYKGKKIVDYKKNPLSLMVYSEPFQGTVTLEELKKHINTNEERPKFTPYSFKFYERDWGFSLPFGTKLKDGDYEVFIDTEFKPGVMKLGVHTIPGKSDREILLFAHLDHPYQANDNLSAVACLADLAPRLKADHTIKIIFCPETIGSIAYGETQDLSKVDFVIAVDICGNNNSILLQKTFDRVHRINRAANLAVKSIGDHRIGDFRTQIGSDEYYFNDPKVGVPAIMFSTWPYHEYHTDADTPEIIDYDQIKRMQEAVQKTITYYEQDFIPERVVKGPIMRSKYGIQTHDKLRNTYYDYFFYFMDGKAYLSELCAVYGIDFEQALEFISKMEKDGIIRRVDPSQE
jgi:aminopeptidase-like protein